MTGWVLPGLVDAHCHVGLDRHGPVDADTAEKQALTDRDAGTLLIRDAGSPSDTRWIDDREDLPKIIRAGRHIARTRRYIRNYAHEIEPADLVAYVGREARRGDGWVKLVGDWIDREAGDLTACWPRPEVGAAIAEAHRLGARVTAHCFAEDSSATSSRRASTASSTPPGSPRRPSRSSPSGASPSSRPWSTSRPSRTSRTAARRSSPLVGPHATVARAAVRHGPRRLRRGRPGLRRHRRRRLPRPRPGRGGGRGADPGRHPADRRPLGHHLGARAWLGRPALEEGAPPTSSSTARTRARTSASWRRRGGSSSTGGSWADGRVVADGRIVADGPRTRDTPRSLG